MKDVEEVTEVPEVEKLKDGQGGGCDGHASPILSGMGGSSGDEGIAFLNPVETEVEGEGKPEPEINVCCVCASTDNVRKCGGCKSTFYCSKKCQVDHHSYHGPHSSSYRHLGLLIFCQF